MKRLASIFVAVGLLAGCGGGGDAGEAPVVVAPPPEPPQEETPPAEEPVNTADVEASDDFDFRTDRDAELSVSGQVPGEGIINVYYGYEFHDTTDNVYYPDYNTRILSFNPQVTTSITIQISRNWDALYVEFVPTEAGLTEQYHKIELDADNDPVIILD